MDALPIFESQGHATIPIFLVLGAAYIAWRLWTSRRQAQGDIPLYGKELGNAEKRRHAYIQNAWSLYARGYKAFKHSFFRLTDTDGEKIIVPRHMLDELRRLPDTHLSLDKAFDIINERKYTGLGDRHQGDFLVHCIRSDLTNGLNRIHPRLMAEVDFTVPLNLPLCEEWTPVVIYEQLLRIVAVVSGNIFIGPEHCHHEDFIHHSINYTLDVFRGAANLKKWHPWLRPIGQYFVTNIRHIHEHKRMAHKFFAPIVEERRTLMRDGGELPDDMLQWMLSKSEKHDIDNEDITELLLNLSLAAIHTTTMTVTLLLYDLVIRPEIVEELRQEIESVMAEHDGVLSTSVIYRMKLLDSVMKESQRMNPGNLVRFTRYVDQPVTLSNGMHLPRGAFIESPHACVLKDPEIFAEPDQFNPRRFLDFRNGTVPDKLGYKNREQYQFVTVTKEFMAFGYGRHACPGRFFAANEIKLIMIRLLLDYDLAMPDGRTVRYDNVGVAADALPDPTRTIMMKRRKKKA